MLNLNSSRQVTNDSYRQILNSLTFWFLGMWALLKLKKTPILQVE
jgi:hypothetical protein